MIKQLIYLCKENSVFRYAISFFIIGMIVLLLYSANSGQKQSTQPGITHNQQVQKQSGGGAPSFSIFKIF